MLWLVVTLIVGTIGMLIYDNYNKKKIFHADPRLLKDNDLISQLRMLAEASEKLNNFYLFECSDFFKGKDLANLNRKTYEKLSDEHDTRYRAVKEEMIKRGLIDE